MENDSLIKRFVNGSKASIPEIIMLCAAASLSAMFYYHEDHIPHSGYMKLAAFCVMAAVWIWSAVICGKDKRASFPLILCIYWTVPYAFTFYYDARDNVRNYSKALSFLNRVSTDIAFSPFKEISRTARMDLNIVITVFLFTVIVFYMFGFLIRCRCDKAFPQKGERFRKDNISENNDENV